MAGVRKPLEVLTLDRKGPIIIIFCYSLASISITTAVIRFGLAVLRRIRFGLDDVTYILANVFAIASSVVLHLATNAGLGRHVSQLSSNDVDKYFKLMYAAQFLEIAACLFAKASVILLSERVIPQSFRASFGITLVVVIWGIFSIFAVAFQCPLPSPWNLTPSECPTQGKLLYPIIIFNALTDTVLAVWIIPKVWKLNMSRKFRVLVCALFATRLAVWFPAAGELSLLGPFLASPDQTWSRFGPVLLQQATMYISVICATLPRTNQFLSGLQSGGSTLRVPDFEIYYLDSSKQSDRESNPVPLKLVPENDSKLSTKVYPSSSDSILTTKERLSTGQWELEENARSAGWEDKVVFKRLDFEMKVSNRAGPVSSESPTQ